MLDEKTVPKYDPTVYSQIALNDLVTYAVYFLSQMSETISSENITAGCFLLFPARFSLRGYPAWPDSTVVNKRWIDCRNKGYITGSTASDFSLTPKGLALAEKVEKMLTGKRPIISRSRSKDIKTEMRTRAGRFVRELEESDAYRAYKREGQRVVINEFDFRSMLLCTMESSGSTLRKNLEQFKQYTTEYKRNDLLEFLVTCEHRFSHILREAPKGQRIRGGMLPKKTK